jgi:hypothetical protein
MKKIADLAVKVGQYVKDGETKNRYKNVGIVLQKDDGSKMRMIDPTFNFAAVKLDEGRDYVIISEFEIKDKAEPAQKPTAGAPQFDE